MIVFVSPAKFMHPMITVSYSVMGVNQKKKENKQEEEIK